jgi:exopolyphosphatase/guanosine-5'-triphosphate,3'-diphosphate pyrophosphatase
MRGAVWDLGSNSVKFLVADRAGSSFRVVAEDSHGTRLAEDLIHTGSLKPEAMDRTFAVLRDLRVKAEKLGCTHFDAVATSAVRDSSNRKYFLKAAKEILQTPVRLLSGNEEAECIFTGVAGDSRWRGRDLFVIDIGGGSAEWVQGSGLLIEKRMSLPLGAVRLRERFVKHHPVTEEGVETILQALHAQLQPALADYRLGRRAFVGTGGTATCLAAIDRKLKLYHPRQIDHHPVERAALRKRLNALSRLTLEKLARIPGLPPKRIDLIIPGACVLYATMEILGAQRVIASVRGLRYGVMRRLLHPEI